MLVILHQLLLFEQEEERVMIAGDCRQLPARGDDAPPCILRSKSLPHFY